MSSTSGASNLETGSPFDQDMIDLYHVMVESGRVDSDQLYKIGQLIGSKDSLVSTPPTMDQIQVFAQLFELRKSLDMKRIQLAFYLEKTHYDPGFLSLKCFWAVVNNALLQVQVKKLLSIIDSTYASGGVSLSMPTRSGELWMHRAGVGESWMLMIQVLERFQEIPPDCYVEVELLEGNSSFDADGQICLYAYDGACPPWDINLTANTVSERDESTSGTSVDGITAGIEQAVISDKNQVQPAGRTPPVLQTFEYTTTCTLEAFQRYTAQLGVNGKTSMSSLTQFMEQNYKTQNKAGFKQFAQRFHSLIHKDFYEVLSKQVEDGCKDCTTGHGSYVKLLSHIKSHFDS